MPAKAGIQFFAAITGFRLRGNDVAVCLRDVLLVATACRTSRWPATVRLRARRQFRLLQRSAVHSDQVVALPPEKSSWITVGGPLALIGLFFLLDLAIWWLVPFAEGRIELNLRELPPAVRRGIAMAVVMFGIAFCFGASEIAYQLKLHGSAEATSRRCRSQADRFHPRAPVRLHHQLFHRRRAVLDAVQPYQVVPVGVPGRLAASVTDVISWWGIKFLAPSFEWVSMFCGVLFATSYLWMLIGLLRVLLFPK